MATPFLGVVKELAGVYGKLQIEIATLSHHTNMVICITMLVSLGALLSKGVVESGFDTVSLSMQFGLYITVFYVTFLNLRYRI